PPSSCRKSGANWTYSPKNWLNQKPRPTPQYLENDRAARHGLNRQESAQTAAPPERAASLPRIDNRRILVRPQLSIPERAEKHAPVRRELRERHCTQTAPARL